MTHGYLKAIFDIFDKHQCPVDMVSTSEVSVSLTVDSNDKLPAHRRRSQQAGRREVRRQEGARLPGRRRHPRTERHGGAGLQRHPHINVRMISQGASEINMSFMIDEEDADEAVRSLHAAFFKDPDPMHLRCRSRKAPLAISIGEPRVDRFVVFGDCAGRALLLLPVRCPHGRRPEHS